MLKLRSRQAKTLPIYTGRWDSWRMDSYHRAYTASFKDLYYFQIENYIKIEINDLLCEQKSAEWSNHLN